jgi:hypothetical protein
MPKTTTAKTTTTKTTTAKNERKLEESFPITTTRGSIAKKHQLPADMIESMQNALKQKWRPEVDARWFALRQQEVRYQ